MNWRSRLTRYTRIEPLVISADIATDAGGGHAVRLLRIRDLALTKFRLIWTLSGDDCPMGLTLTWLDLLAVAGVMVVVTVITYAALFGYSWLSNRATDRSAEVQDGEGFVEELPDMHEPWETSLENVVRLIEEYGQVAGEHHKQWVIDQTARALMGQVGYRGWRLSRPGSYDEDTAP